MKKIITLLIFISFCTGCSIYETKDMKISQLEEIFLVKENRYNQSFSGYRYYLPVGIKNSKKVENTFKLSYKNTYIYLYVDLISYLNIIVYNYGRIEGVVESKNLNDALSNSMMILSSIKYNDKLLNNVYKKDNERAKNFDLNNTHQIVNEEEKKRKSEDDLNLNFK